MFNSQFFWTEGPLAHDQPTYAGLPGINVYGMLCVPPQSSAGQSFVSKWKDNPRFPVSYRSKNSTIQAEGSDDENTNDINSGIENETIRVEEDDTTVTEAYQSVTQPDADFTDGVTDFNNMNGNTEQAWTADTTEYSL